MSIEVQEFDPVGVIGKPGFYENTGTRPAVIVSDINSSVEVEPAASDTSLIVWSWGKGGECLGTFVLLDDATKLAARILGYVVRQKLRQVFSKPELWTESGKPVPFPAGE